jgi:hypothetical protein
MSLLLVPPQRSVGQWPPGAGSAAHWANDTLGQRHTGPAAQPGVQRTLAANNILNSARAEFPLPDRHAATVVLRRGSQPP